MLTVYSKNNCSSCTKLKTQLDLWEIEYREISIETDLDARNWIVEQGHKTVPVLYRGLQKINHIDLTKEILIKEMLK